MKRTTGTIIVLAALASAGAKEVGAQDEAPERRVDRGTPAVEAIMQMRDRLELTEGQLTDLEALRRESVDRRNAELAEVAEMRSRLAAGQIQRSDYMAFLEDRRENRADPLEERTARIETILDEGQLETLDELRGNARAFAAGRVRGMRGNRGFRGDRGFRGTRGEGGFRGARRGFDGRPGFRDGRRGPPRGAWRGR